MKPTLFGIAITVLTAILFASTILAVPPTDEVIQRLKDEGRFDQFLEVMAEAHAKGVDSPAADMNKAGAKNSLSSQTTMRVLVILIDFPGKSYTGGYAAPTAAAFDSLLFSDGLNPTGSMKEFYYQNSYGNFTLVGDVIGWFTASQNASYYTNDCDGSHGMGPYPHNAQKLVEEAVDLANPYVDFSQYDNDGNGYVDGIFVVHAGTGYEETGNDCEIHSHQWSISARYKDGVYISTYSIEPEESPSSAGMIPIGVFCHEYGHVLGLPDLYDGDYSSRGVGRWELMGSGSYNGQSRIPSQLSAWSKARLGWMSLTNVTTNQTNVAFPALEWNPVAYRLWKNGSGGSQYFVVENRQKMGFDAGLPGSGLLIWHIDESVWGNNNDWHPEVFLEQADGKFDLQNNTNSGDAGDPYPNGGYSPNFTDKTNPNSRAYNATVTQAAVWDISPSDSIITAGLDVNWSRPYLYLTNYTFSDVVGGDGDGFLEAGETIRLTVTVGNDWKAVSSSNLELSADDGRLVITTGSVPLGAIPSGGSANNNVNPLIFEVPADYVPRIDSFFCTIVCDGGTYTGILPIQQNVGATALLLVDDDNNDTMETFYSKSLYNKRVPYDRWIKWSAGSPSLAELNKYDAVVWFTGDFRVAPLTSTDVTTMQGYLDGGSGLFLSGQGIAYQLSTLNPGFLSNYLKASYQSNSYIPVVTPHASSQIFSGLGMTAIQGSGGASNQTKPDHLSAVGGGVPELIYYGTSDIAAVSYAGSYKSVFFGFGHEAIVNGDQRFVERDTILTRVLGFLGVNSSSGYPEIVNVDVGPGNPMNLVDHTPELTWSYWDAGGAPQQEYHVQVGTDGDWSVAEMWNLGPSSGSDTSVIYGGVPLVDGQTYHFRVQVYNGIQWSNWYAGQFRMNSVPAAPTGLTPGGLAAVTSATPNLGHQNAVDAEGNTLTYYYEVYGDSLLTTLIAQGSGPEQPVSSSWTVSVPLTDDAVYYWRVRANDVYEYGPWSQPASFWVNSNNQVPTAFNLIAPANDSQTTNLLPTFAWSPSAAGDLYDTVRYSFIIAVDSTFTQTDTAKGLTDTVLTLTDSLGYGHNYSWKVLAVDKFGGVTQSGQVFKLTTWLPGDANSDGRVDVGDVITIINYVFRGGTPPDPLKIGDANGDCSTNVGDAVYLIKFIFSSGPPPVPGCA